MEELKQLLSGLKTNDENQAVGALQKIGSALIQNYKIEVRGMVIEPLWVEAYYYSKENFPDCNTHLSEKQKNRFGQLYFHETGRGGFDICLSNDNEYYLSFLIKAYLLNGSFNKQKDFSNGLTKEMKDKYENETDILRKKNVETLPVVEFSERINLVKPCYTHAKLAIFSLDAISKYDFGFARKSLSQNAEQYIKDFIESSNKQYTKQVYREKCKEVFGWIPDSVTNLLKQI